ncbi:MAG: hypothetical protein H6Q78_896 [Candidatus Krumholzibacteriota bacterium]|nr:hypothetical protein [Candidatus Krumholzibacteriota bacterium]
MKQPKGKKTLGRDVFAGRSEKDSGAIGKILQGRRFPDEARVKEIEVRVKLTPSNLKHLEALASGLESKGKGRFSRNELIRVAITLLSADDF